MHLNSRTGKEGAEKEGRKRERRESEGKNEYLNRLSL